jgi:hypothetical protein
MNKGAVSNVVIITVAPGEGPGETDKIICWYRKLEKRPFGVFF